MDTTTTLPDPTLSTLAKIEQMLERVEFLTQEVAYLKQQHQQQSIDPQQRALLEQRFRLRKDDAVSMRSDI